MTDVTSFKCSEGIIYKKSDFLRQLSNKPREGTYCEVSLIVEPSFASELENYESSYLIQTGDEKNETIKIQIGVSSVSRVDRLIDICISSMNEGETSYFTLELSQDNNLSFTAYLKSFDDFPELFDLPDETKLEMALRLKNSGVELYKKEKIVDAFQKFSKALKYLIIFEDEALKSSSSEVLMALYCNLAGCHISRKNWEYAIILCTKVLEKDVDNIKALYRRGWALLELNEFERSRLDLSRAQGMEPNNQSIKAKLLLLNERVKQCDAKLSVGMKKMFT